MRHWLFRQWSLSTQIFILFEQSLDLIARVAASSENRTSVPSAGINSVWAGSSPALRSGPALRPLDVGWSLASGGAVFNW